MVSGLTRNQAQPSIDVYQRIIARVTVYGRLPALHG
jgi:hypothetical protein